MTTISSTTIITPLSTTGIATTKHANYVEAFRAGKLAWETLCSTNYYPLLEVQNLCNADSASDVLLDFDCNAGKGNGWRICIANINTIRDYALGPHACTWTLW